MPGEKAQRATPRQATGSETIPALRLEEGTIATGEAAIRRYLDDHFPVEADADQLKAAQARRRYLEEECECSQPATR